MEGIIHRDRACARAGTDACGQRRCGGSAEQIGIARVCGVGTVEVGGELDASNARALVGQLLRRGSGGPELIVDLRAVTFIDCAGVHALATVAARRRCRDERTTFVVAAGGPVEKLLALTGAAPSVDAVLRLEGARRPSRPAEVA